MGHLSNEGQLVMEYLIRGLAAAATIYISVTAANWTYDRIDEWLNSRKRK